METKEQILNKRNWNSEYPNYMAESEIHEAMDEWAKEMSVKFAKWNSIYFYFKEDDHWLNALGQVVSKTTEDHYNLFLQSIQQL